MEKAAREGFWWGRMSSRPAEEESCQWFLQLGESARDQRRDGMPLYSCNWELQRQVGKGLRASVRLKTVGN